jgi:hypothetical protein
MKCGESCWYGSTRCVCQGYTVTGLVRIHDGVRLLFVRRERVKRWKIKRAKWRAG